MVFPFLLSAFLSGLSPQADWELYKAYPRVDVFIASADCTDGMQGETNRYALLKFVNKTDQKLTLTWKMERYKSNVCRTCGVPEIHICKLNLEPLQSLEGSCDRLLPETGVFLYRSDRGGHATFIEVVLKHMRIKRP